MEKTEQMYRFEQETGLEALVTVPLEGDSLTVVSEEYTRCLESKAEAYDRLMSGRATPKELANILQAYVACNDNGRWSYFWTRPHAGKTEWYVGDYQGVLRGIALLDLPPCSCHWTDSLIVPDGLEDK